MLISRLKTADRHNIHVTVQESAKIVLKVNLIEDRGTRAELHKEVDIGILVIFTARYRAKHLDVQRMPTSEETLDLLSMPNHDVANLTHDRILTEHARSTFSSATHRQSAIRVCCVDGTRLAREDARESAVRSRAWRRNSRYASLPGVSPATGLTAALPGTGARRSALEETTSRRATRLGAWSGLPRLWLPPCL